MRLDSLHGRIEREELPLSRATRPAARLLLVDDHPLVRRGLRDILEYAEGVEVVAEAGGYAEALAKVESLELDLVILDLTLGDGSGLELLKQVRARRPELKILVCSMHDEVLYAERVLRAGGRGYLSKDEAIDRVVEAVRRVLDGRLYLSPGMTDRLLRAATGGEVATGNPLASLSDRELQVFELIGEALSAREIGERLGISPKTVESYRESMKAKLGVDSPRELLRRAIHHVLEKDVGRP